MLSIVLHEGHGMWKCIRHLKGKQGNAVYICIYVYVYMCVYIYIYIYIYIYGSKVWGQIYIYIYIFFIFIDFTLQGCIKLIKSNRKDIELSIHQP